MFASELAPLICQAFIRIKEASRQGTLRTHNDSTLHACGQVPTLEHDSAETSRIADSASGFCQLTTLWESAITEPMRVQDFHKEPRPTLSESVFSYKDRISEPGRRTLLGMAR